MIEGILFDKDGTLVDFNATWLPAYRTVTADLSDGDVALAERLLRAGGVDPDSGRFAAGSMFAVGPISDIADVWRPLLAERARPDLATAVIDGLAAATLDHCRALPGAAGLLERLAARGLKLGVATNDGERGTRAMLAKLDLTSRLDFIAGWDSGFAAKPAPDMVQGFCDATGLAASAVMVVGDSAADLKMARGAGAGHCVGVLSGVCGWDELGPHADTIIDSIATLEELLP